MAKKISTQYDFQKIPQIGMVVETKSSAPSSPVNGQQYYDTTTNRTYSRENGAWVLMSQTGTLLTSQLGAANGAASLDSGSKVPIAQIPTGQTDTTVPLGNDARFTDQRVPTDASVTGGPAGTGVKIAAGTITKDNIANATITDVQIAAANKDGAAGTASMRTLGTGATQAAAGNDSRLSDTRTPTAGSVVPASFGATAIDPVAGTAGARTLGLGAQQAMPGNTTLNGITAPTAAVSLNSQRITSLAPSAAATDAVNRAELDAAMQGIKGVKNPVTVALTTNVNLAAPGAALDGVTLTAGVDSFLAAGQTTGTQNGIYLFNGSGVAATRRNDADATGEIGDGTMVAVSQGTYAGSQFIQTATESGAPGAWTQTWVVFNTGGTTYTNGNGLNLSSNQFSVKKDTTDATNPISVTANGVGLGTVDIAHGGTGATTLSAAKTALGIKSTYTADMVALTAGVEVTVTHNLGTTDTIESFKIVADQTKTDMTVRTIDANSIGVTSDVAYAAAGIRIAIAAC